LNTGAPELLVTLCPSFAHFKRFARDERLVGIRINSAMLSPDELDKELRLAKDLPVPLWFDVKGRQLRIAEILENPDYLDIRLNHPITVNTPTVVLLKAGGDQGLLGEVSEDGYRLTFSGNPYYKVKDGESLHIKDPSLRVHGDLFSEVELEKIEKVKAAGITRWFLSYVEEQSDIDQFRELVGQDAELMLKIESKRGLRFVEEQFHKDEFTRLVAACGDMYVEVDKPHHILGALQTVIDHDPEAIAASRMLLSIVHEPVPSMADFAHLAWLYEMGYRSYMLCDELCLKEDFLSMATNAFRAFRADYPGRARNVVESIPRPYAAISGREGIPFSLSDPGATGFGRR